ncbi:Cerato-platanin [Collybia nuda]|uniref:Cerato-platanin n=1 Tax=Collybia nuda TaxID=64659 RepID=A0A9P5XW48_9AGAR|nr:Cerato-platanin [Collybia nuda]
MKFSVTLAPLVLSLLPSLASAISLAYDPVYDNAQGSLTTVACSDGDNGLIRRGFTTFGSLPKFPHIGAAAVVTGWNSAACGTCWKLTYENSDGESKSINVLAIDAAGSGAGFNVALAAMNELTGGNAMQLGRVEVESEQMDASVCGL